MDLLVGPALLVMTLGGLALGVMLLMLAILIAVALSQMKKEW